MRRIRALSVGLLILAACSSGKDLPPGAYKNEPFGVAVVPPAGWTLVTPAKAAEFLAQHGDRLLDSSRKALTSPVTGRTSLVAVFVKTDSADPLFPIIGVVHNSVGLPAGAGVPEKEISERTLKAKLRASGYFKPQMDVSDFIVVDSRNSVRLGYHGEVDSVLHSNPLALQRYPIRFLEIMVPSRNMTHFLSLHTDPKEWDAHEKTFGQFLKSFRSLDPH